MIKTIQIGDKEVQLNNNIGWTIEYRDQFNTDILPTLMPLIAGVVDSFVGLLSSTGKTDNFEVTDLVSALKSEEFFDAMVKISSFDFVDLINITWALAKTADESIPEPRRWVKDLGEFPLDIIGPAVFELVFKGVISSKNWERLQKTMDGLKPKKEKKNM